MGTPRIQIAILTYNALEFTERCLDSVAANTAVDHDVVILDNGSEDGTREWLTSRRASSQRIMLNPCNVGVAKGRNILLADILERADPDDLIVFLDNDVEVKPCWHEPFSALFVRQPLAAIAGVTGHDIIVSEDLRTLLPSPEAGAAQVDVVSGYCLAVPADIAARVGPFDENLGLFWHEDDDYCLRAIALGYRVYCLPEAGIIHHGHKSGMAGEAGDPEESLRNQRYLASKWRALGLIDATGRIVRTAGRSDIAAEAANPHAI